jgi:large subunit ribosomal protein L34e
MVHGANKSGSRKRTDVRTPSQTKQRFGESRNSKPVSVTGQTLPGTVRGTPSEIRNVSRTKRSPNRPFGGVLSSSELREYYRMQLSLEPSE